MYLLIVTTITAYGAVHTQRVADDFASYQSCASFAVAWIADQRLDQGDTVQWQCERAAPLTFWRDLPSDRQR